MCNPSQQFKLFKLFFKKTSALACPVRSWGIIRVTGEHTTIVSIVVVDGLVLETWAVDLALLGSPDILESP